MKKLISLSDFVLNIGKMTLGEFRGTFMLDEAPRSDAKALYKVMAVQRNMIVDYAKFLKTDLSKDIVSNQLVGFKKSESEDKVVTYANGRLKIELMKGTEVHSGDKNWYCAVYGLSNWRPVVKVEDLVGMDVLYKKNYE